MSYEKLYPPYLEGTLPAFYKGEGSFYKDKVELTIPFSMNPSVNSASIKGFTLKLKTVQTGNTVLLTYSSAYDIDKNYVIFTLDRQQASEINIGQHYKAQLAYYTDSSQKAQSTGYFSTVGIIKCVSQPEIYIKGLDADGIGIFNTSYTGVYSLENKEDNSEKVYSYQFIIREASEDKVLFDSGELIHNSSEDTNLDISFDEIVIDNFAKTNIIYSIQYIVTTLNGLVIKSPKYKISNTQLEASPYNIEILPTNIYTEAYNEINFRSAITSFSKYNVVSDIDLRGKKYSIVKSLKDAANNNDTVYLISYNSSINNLYEGYIYNTDLKKYQNIGFFKGEEQKCYGNFILSRASNEDNYSTWINICTFNLENVPASQFSYKDFCISQGVNYKYGIQQYNNYGIYSARTESEAVSADYEDAYLYDGELQLKIRYNGKIDSFKNDVLEQKIDTIGSKYPFIFRNGVVNYKEFPLGGLITFSQDEQSLFHKIEKQDLTSLTREEEVQDFDEDVNYDNYYSSFNVKHEREFKLKVLDWLTNGKPKLFKSPYEGLYIVRLLEVSLSPEDTLGRLLHNFSSTAYEIAEVNYKNLIKYGFLKEASNLAGDSIYGQYDCLLGEMKIGIDGNYSLTFDKDDKISYLSFKDLIPGTILEINYHSSDDTDTIMIGNTGAYFCKVYDKVPAVIKISSAGNRQGIVTIGSFIKTVTPFDAFTNIMIKTIIGQTVIGNPNDGLSFLQYYFRPSNEKGQIISIGENAGKELQKTDLRLNVKKSSIEGYSNLSAEGYNLIKEFKNDEYKNFIFSTNQHINSDVEKIQIKELLYGRFQRRPIIPIYLLGEGSNKRSYSYIEKSKRADMQNQLGIYRIKDFYMSDIGEDSEENISFQRELKKYLIPEGKEASFCFNLKPDRTQANKLKYDLPNPISVLDSFYIFKFYDYATRKPITFERPVKVGEEINYIEEEVYGDNKSGNLYTSSTLDTFINIEGSEIDLCKTNIYEVSNIKNPTKICIGNAVMADLSYTLKVIDYYPEVEDDSVVSLKNKYLNTKDYLDNLYAYYMAFQQIDYNKSKYYYLSMLYDALVENSEIAKEDDRARLQDLLQYDSDTNTIKNVAILEELNLLNIASNSAEEAELDFIKKLITGESLDQETPLQKKEILQELVRNISEEISELDEQISNKQDSLGNLESSLESKKDSYNANLKKYLYSDWIRYLMQENSNRTIQSILDYYTSASSSPSDIGKTYVEMYSQLIDTHYVRAIKNNYENKLKYDQLAADSQEKDQDDLSDFILREISNLNVSTYLKSLYLKYYDTQYPEANGVAVGYTNSDEQLVKLYEYFTTIGNYIQSIYTDDNREQVKNYLTNYYNRIKNYPTWILSSSSLTTEEKLNDYFEILQYNTYVNLLSYDESSNLDLNSLPLIDVQDLNQWYASNNIREIPNEIMIHPIPISSSSNGSTWTSNEFLQKNVSDFVKFVKEIFGSSASLEVVNSIKDAYKEAANTLKSEAEGIDLQLRQELNGSSSYLNNNYTTPDFVYTNANSNTAIIFMALKNGTLNDSSFLSESISDYINDEYVSPKAQKISINEESQIMLAHYTALSQNYIDKCEDLTSKHLDARIDYSNSIQEGSEQKRYRDYFSNNPFKNNETIEEYIDRQKKQVLEYWVAYMIELDKVYTAECEGGLFV